MANTAKIIELVTPVLLSHGAFLVDLQVRGDRKMSMVEIFVDTETGIHADLCAEISREIAPILDASGEYSGKYNIVVSSPGLDRPLKFLQQYRRNIGRTVTVVYQTDEGVRKIQGELVEVQPDFISIRRDKGEPERIPMTGVVQTLVIPRW